MRRVVPSTQQHAWWLRVLQTKATPLGHQPGTQPHGLAPSHAVKVAVPPAEGPMNFTRIYPRISTLLILSVIGGWFAQPAVAQTYPSGPIHIIVPYAAGG